MRELRVVLTNTDANEEKMKSYVPVREWAQQESECRMIRRFDNTHTTRAELTPI